MRIRCFLINSPLSRCDGCGLQGDWFGSAVFGSGDQTPLRSTGFAGVRGEGCVTLMAVKTACGLEWSRAGAGGDMLLLVVCDW